MADDRLAFCRRPLFWKGEYAIDGPDRDPRRGMHDWTSPGRDSPRLMGMHSPNPPRSRRRLVLLALGLIVAVVVAAVTVAVRLRQDKPQLTAVPSGGHNVMVLSVSPVGGQVDGGLQTVASAEADLQHALDYGAIGIRVTADVSWLCSPSSCQMSPLGPIVTKARQLGLEVYLQVNSTPSWMDDRGTWYGPSGANAGQWAQLFAQFVQHFGTQIAGYEVWNEPNNPDAWTQGPDPRQYADLLKAVWTASKAVNPQVSLVGGVLSNNDLGYMRHLDEALRERGGNAQNSFFYDELGVHPYAGRHGEGYDPRLPAGSKDLRTDLGIKDMTFQGVERLRSQIHADEGIWRDVVIGEFGYDTTNGSWYHVPEPKRAAFLTEALQLAASWDWVRAFTVYTGDGFTIDGTDSAAALQRTTAALRR